MSKGSINIKSRSTYNFTKEYTAECDIYIYVINWCMKHFFDILEYSDYKITSVGYTIFWHVLVTHWLMLAKCLGKSSSYQKVLAIFFLNFRVSLWCKSSIIVYFLIFNLQTYLFSFGVCYAHILTYLLCLIYMNAWYLQIDFALLLYLGLLCLYRHTEWKGFKKIVIAGEIKLRVIIKVSK